MSLGPEPGISCVDSSGRSPRPCAPASFARVGRSFRCSEITFVRLGSLPTRKKTRNCAAISTVGIVRGPKTEVGRTSNAIKQIKLGPVFGAARAEDSQDSLDI